VPTAPERVIAILWMAVLFLAPAVYVFFVILVCWRRAARSAKGRTAVVPSKLTIWNKGADDLTVWVEPLAYDYTLEPGERLEISTRNHEALLELSRHEQSIEIFLQSWSDFDVVQNGVALECGHKRKS
jgi:hypothetical protein